MASWSWSEVAADAPELAAKVRARFEATGLGFLATLRHSGFPRISGVEPLFTDSELWLGMMEHSRKGADLRRDPRLSLHSASTDKSVAEGDAKLAGRAVAVDDSEDLDRFRRDFAAATGAEVPSGPMELFLVEVTELSFLRPAGDHLVIEWWRQGGSVQRVERR